jgi:hypothetical protein
MSFPQALTDCFNENDSTTLAKSWGDVMHPIRSAWSNILAWLILVAILSSCVSPGESEPYRRLPTPAEVEQYNASVPPEERIICRTEIPVGSNIPVRKCRLAVDIDETSTFHREQLRRALR